MPALLYGIGIFALFAGLVMVGFGIPINEFSFGNTLISAGTTAAVGGLIIIGLGVLTGQVRRLAQMLAMQEAGQRQPIETSENVDPTSVTAPQARVPFPARSRPEPHTPIHAGAASTAAPFEDLAESVMPTLRNPDETAAAAEDEVSLSPRHPLAPASHGAGDLGGPRAGSGPTLGSMPDKNREPATGWRSVAVSSTSTASQERPLHTANFDTMWPAEVKLPNAPNDTSSEAKPDPSSRDTVSRRRDPEPQKARAPAVLKSGVVDGMGYTLYVDGSIEAELPQGTLRFASINELRSHLAKKS
jgi:hypothetical protein